MDAFRGAASSWRAWAAAFALAAVGFASFDSRAFASEAGQGTFHATLLPGAGCAVGQDATFQFESTFQFDDKTFVVNLPPGNNQLQLNFSDLGVFHAQGTLQCQFDVGGSFTSTAINEAGDFQWVDLDGEYLDHKPGISEGDPFPWVAGARCVTTRTDDFKTLCDNFELSWNGLSKALAPTSGYNDFAGDLNVRTAAHTHVDPNPQGSGQPVVAPATVDDAGGSIPEVQIHFRNGIAASGDVRIRTLADAHGETPSSAAYPVRGTTEIDHGSGPQPFFEGGDERFVDIDTTAALPPGADLEVCLPMPKPVVASDVRPVHVLHGEGGDFGSRRFVDRTSRLDHAGSMACAAVSGLSKFAVVTSDVCGNGRKTSDGILTVAGGLVGKKNLIVDGVTDCANFPPDLPASLCVPDADSVSGQCSVSLKLGVLRAGCNQVAAGVDPNGSDIDPYSYAGSIRGKEATIDLEPLFHDALYSLVNRREATVGPVTVALPATGSKTKYRLKQSMSGAEPGTGAYVRDSDAATITCIEP